MKEQLLQDLKEAMREKDTIKKDAITMLRASILQVEKDTQKTLNDDEVINASDDRFENGEKKSDIVVDIKFSKNEGDERNHYNYSKVVDGKVIGALSDYALNLIQKACFDIESLDITPCPLVINSDDPCKMCRFSALCKFDSSFGNIKRTPIKKIDYKDFIKENDK